MEARKAKPQLLSLPGDSILGVELTSLLVQNSRVYWYILEDVHHLECLGEGLEGGPVKVIGGLVEEEQVVLDED